LIAAGPGHLISFAEESAVEYGGTTGFMVTVEMKSDDLAN